MTPVVWFTLVVVTIIGLVALDQVPLVVDLVTATGFSSAEVFSGIGAILMVFYVVIAIFWVRG